MLCNWVERQIDIKLSRNPAFRKIQLSGYQGFQTSSFPDIQLSRYIQLSGYQAFWKYFDTSSFLDIQLWFFEIYHRDLPKHDVPVPVKISLETVHQNIRICLCFCICLCLCLCPVSYDFVTGLRSVWKEFLETYVEAPNELRRTSMEPITTLETYTAAAELLHFSKKIKVHCETENGNMEMEFGKEY